VRGEREGSEKGGREGEGRRGKGRGGEGKGGSLLILLIMAGMSVSPHDKTKNDWKLKPRSD